MRPWALAVLLPSLAPRTSTCWWAAWRASWRGGKLARPCRTLLHDRRSDPLWPATLWPATQ